MILPWIQVDRETFERAAELAAILGISEHEAGWSIVCLWRWALSRPADGGLTGVVSGPTAVVQLEAGMRWAGERGALVDALVEIGLLRRARGGDHYKVRGLDRYRATLKSKSNKATREAARRKLIRDAENERGGHVAGMRRAHACADVDVDVKGAHDGLEERVES
jgi:hypothetical protein